MLRQILANIRSSYSKPRIYGTCQNQTILSFIYEFPYWRNSDWASLFRKGKCPPYPFVPYIRSGQIWGQVSLGIWSFAPIRDHLPSGVNCRIPELVSGHSWTGMLISHCWVVLTYAAVMKKFVGQWRWISQFFYNRRNLPWSSLLRPGKMSITFVCRLYQVMSGMGAYAGTARRRVHVATVLLRPPSGHRPGKRQARHVRFLQIGLRLDIAQADARPVMPIS